MYSVWIDNHMIWYQGSDDPNYALFDIRLEEEVNKAGSLEFTIPITNNYYDYVKNNKLHADVSVKYSYLEDVREDIMWRGRILHDERDFYNSRKVYCEGQLSFLLDSIVRPYERTCSPAEMLSFYINQHNDQVYENRKFLMGTCDVGTNIYRASEQYPNTLNEIQEKLLDDLGGYLIPRYLIDQDKWCIDYLTEYQRASTPYDINFGENLLDVSITSSADDYYNCVIPLGATDQVTGKKLTVESITGGLDYIEVGIQVVDRVTRVLNFDTITDPANLFNVGQDELNKHINFAVNYSINAVSAHHFVFSDTMIDKRIMLGDMVHVKSAPHQLDLDMMVTKIEHDLEDPSNTKYSFGSELKTLTYYYL